MDEHTHAQMDGGTTDQLWYKMNIPFFLMKKSRYNKEWEGSGIFCLHFSIRFEERNSYLGKNCKHKFYLVFTLTH